jgi:hypothetical protein
MQFLIYVCTLYMSETSLEVNSIIYINIYI